MSSTAFLVNPSNCRLRINWPFLLQMPTVRITINIITWYLNRKQLRLSLPQFNSFMIIGLIWQSMNIVRVIIITMLSNNANPDKLPTTCKVLTKIHSGPIYTVKFNSAGEYCMSGSQDRSVTLYNPSKNIMIKNYKNIHNYDVYTLDISKDNSKFITGGGDKNVILTDVIEGKYIRKYTGHTARINSVCFSPDNNVIISASYDTSVRCWDNRSDSYHPIEIIKGFKDSVSQVRTYGSQIICSSMDGNMKFFDIRKGEVTTDSMSEGIQRFEIAHSRKAYVVSAINSKLYLIEKATGFKIQEYEGHNIGEFTVDVLFNAKDTHMITGAADGKLYIYDIMKKEPIKAIAAHEKVLSALDLHESGGMVSGSHDGTIAYWKI